MLNWNKIRNLDNGQQTDDPINTDGGMSHGEQ